MPFKSTIGDLGVVISADTTGVTKGVKQTDQALDQSNKALERNQKQWSKWGAAIQLAAVATAGLAIKQSIAYSDAVTSINNKLKLATANSTELANATQRLFQISNESGSSIETNVELYAKMERATRSLNVSQEKLLSVTGSITKAFAISGASTQEASGAMRQLGQALGSGALRGDEFNSIAEQAPIILEAVSKATGQTAGELRELAAEGLISAEILIESLDRYKDKIDTDFSTATKTYAQKLEIATNNAIKFVSENDTITSSVARVGDGIVLLSENIDTIVVAAEALSIILISRLTPALLANLAVSARTAVTYDVMTGAAVRASVANRSLAASATMARGALALLGGPIGILVAAAASLATFVDWESDAEKQAKRTTQEIDDQTAALKGLNKEQAAGKMQEFAQTAIEAEFALIPLREELAALQAKMSEPLAQSGFLGGSQIQMEKTKAKAEELLNKIRELESVVSVSASGFGQLETQNAESSGGEEELINLRARAQEKADAEEVEKARKKAQELLGVQMDAWVKSQELEKARAEEYLAQLDERFMTDEEFENARYAAELARLQEALLLTGATKEQAFQLESSLLQEHEDELTRIKQAGEDARLAIVADAMDSAAQVLMMGGKKAQKIGKALAIASAVIKGKEAAVAAWSAGMSVGGPWAPLVAAAYTAASIAKTGSMIKSIKGSGSSAGGGSGGLPSVPSGPASGEQGGGQSPSAPRTINISMVGSGMFSATQVRELMGQINEQVGDGVTLNTTTGG